MKIGQDCPKCGRRIDSFEKGLEGKLVVGHMVGTELRKGRQVSTYHLCMEVPEEITIRIRKINYLFSKTVEKLLNNPPEELYESLLTEYLKHSTEMFRLLHELKTKPSKEDT